MTCSITSKRACNAIFGMNPHKHFSDVRSSQILEWPLVSNDTLVSLCNVEACQRQCGSIDNQHIEEMARSGAGGVAALCCLENSCLTRRKKLQRMCHWVPLVIDLMCDFHCGVLCTNVLHRFGRKCMKVAKEHQPSVHFSFLISGWNLLLSFKKCGVEKILIAPFPECSITAPWKETVIEHRFLVEM